MSRPGPSRGPWVALLRGADMGGHDKLPMKDLAARFTDAGCRDVRTCIQSGNVVFGAPRGQAERAVGAVPGYGLGKIAVEDGRGARPDGRGRPGGGVRATEVAPGGAGGRGRPGAGGGAGGVRGVRGHAGPVDPRARGTVC